MTDSDIIRRGIEPYFLTIKGIVVHGYKRGRMIGYPTANLGDIKTKGEYSDLKDGTYAGFCHISPKKECSYEHSVIYPCLVSIGTNPTFNGTSTVPKTIEVHICHIFPEEFYGQNLSVCLTSFIRPIVHFSSIDELKKTITLDKEYFLDHQADIMREKRSEIMKGLFE
ncbi:Riboflavin kinase like protein [Aduncisulcus paluster]|uniref:riboflavin kinase n=1 Tax=Aduncisulcus paluster TaxID=2918883 RepID=A0ABQ5KSI5_9EUKA|nr:Riboflavin kinase like protein [Aduncisulcus paluster]